MVQTVIEGPEYPKIDTLFKRDDATFVVDPTKIKSPVLATIAEWDVTEKIDGTNVRVMLSANGDVSFGGRSQRAMLPAEFIQTLIAMFPSNKMRELWVEPTQIVLYGEGYGAGIRKGGAYRPDKSFILFDALVDGKWWLERDAVNEVAAKLGIDTVPYLGRMSLSEIVALVRLPFASNIGMGLAEGVVARPIGTLFDGRGERVIIKLKTRDFVAGRR
jgi:hypothetical protein